MNERFGNYDLVRKLAVGGMAEVYLATVVGPEGFHKNVVIKRILPVYSEDPEFVTMFINEARVAAKLQHSNIVQVFDFNRVGDAYYIAMEWVDGVDLERASQLAKQANMPMPQGVAVYIACEALKGLRYAHTRTDQGAPLNLVHRDISPPNLMLSSSGELKIADFGIAKVAIQAAATREGFVKGKLAYMAPEQLVGQRADHRCDIFALGLVLWELLAERPAYSSALTTNQLIQLVREGQIEPLAEVQPSVSPELAAVVHRMIAREPIARYQSAAEAFDALRCFTSATASIAAANYVSELLAHDPAPVDVPRSTQTFESRPNARAPHEPPPSNPFPSPPPFAQQPASAPSPSPSFVVGPRPRALLPLLAAGALAALISLAIAAWATTALRGRRTSPPTLPLIALRVHGSPQSAPIYVDGLQLGRGHSEVVIYGTEGQSLPIRLKGSTALRSEATFGRDAEVSLPNEANSAPVVAATPQTRPDADAQRTPAQTPSAPPKPAPPTAPAPARAALQDSDRAPIASDAHHRREPRHPMSRRESQAAVDIFVKPWAYVYVDGRNAGTTPLKHFSLAPGKHHVRLENPELGRREVRVLSVHPGEVAQLRADWLP